MDAKCSAEYGIPAQPSIVCPQMPLALSLRSEERCYNFCIYKTNFNFEENNTNYSHLKELTHSATNSLW